MRALGKTELSEIAGGMQEMGRTPMGGSHLSAMHPDEIGHGGGETYISYYMGSNGGGAYRAAGGTVAFTSGIESWFGSIVSHIAGWVSNEVQTFETLVSEALGFDSNSNSDGLTQQQAEQACSQVNMVAKAPLLRTYDPEGHQTGVICDQGVMSHIANMDASPIAICRNDGGTWNYQGRFCATK